jgi:hypothetical protein
MWPFKKRDTLATKQIDPAAAWALIVSAVALMASLGVARWSWLLLDEQVQLRKDFIELKNEQEQSNIQYEYWLGKLKDERAAWQKMNEKTGP